MDRVFKRLRTRREGEWKPEYHIPLILPSALLGAVGLALFGWLVQYNVHWAAVDTAVVLALFSMQISGTPLQAYIIDTYPEHASSATAAQQFLRSLAAFALPLASPKMYSTLGYGWGNSMLAFMTVAFGVPAPLLLWYLGPRLRAKAQSSY